MLKKNITSEKLSKKRRSVIAGVCAVMPVLLLLLASIKQFTFRDIVLAIVLVICVSWYLLKIDFIGA